MNRGFNTIVSGLNAARTGLYVTGHNMANTGTVGYVRQQALTHDFLYQSISAGKQIGLGADVTAIRQIRNEYLDISYRTEVGRANFYNIQYAVGNEIETILGELESTYRSQTVLQDMKDALSELSTYPSGLETRGNFVSTATSFITKMNNIYTRLRNEQYNLNEDIKDAVKVINQLTTKINELNIKIANSEASGQRANDFRDERNNAIDELAKYIKIEYKENAKGIVEITTNGQELVVNGFVNHIGLRYTAANSSFVEPVFTTKSEILDYDHTYENAKSVFNFTGIVGSEYGNDYGQLYSLLCARGLLPVNYNTMNSENPYSFNPNWAYNNKDNVPVITSIPGFSPSATAPNLADYTNYSDFINDYNAYMTELETYLTDVKADPNYISLDANDPEKIAFDKFYAAFEEEKAHALTENKVSAYVNAMNYAYPPMAAINNIGSSLDILDLSTLPSPAYDTLKGEIEAAKAAITTSMPDSADYPKGVYDPNYIQDCQDYIKNELMPYIEKMEALFNAPGIEGDWEDYNKELANLKIFKENVVAFNSDLNRLSGELANGPVNKRIADFNATQCTIPRTLRQLDLFFNYTVKLINEELSKGYDLYGNQSQTKIFTTIDGSSVFTLGNVQINPDIVSPEGYNLLCLGDGSGIDSDKYIVSLIDKWSMEGLSIDGSYKMNIEEAYRYVVNDIGVRANKSLSFLNSQTGLVENIDSKRSQVSGVSLDEEMKNMMIYQHAFNAASRVINVIDSMIDKLVNGTGRVGL